MEITRLTNKTQVAILTKFVRSTGLTYSQGKPGRVTNDDYKYHLKELVKDALVEKLGRIYQLTEQGKIAAMHLDAKGVQQEKFWVHVACYIEKNEKILVQKKAKHPYFGDIYVISGKIHIGEPTEIAASRKLFEETGLVCKFKTVGEIRRVRRNISGEIIQDAIFYICYGKNPEGKLIKKNVFGENFWASFRMAEKLFRQNLTAGPKDIDILKLIKKHNFKPFLLHEEITLGKPLP